MHMTGLCTQTHTHTHKTQISCALQTCFQSIHHILPANHQKVRSPEHPYNAVFTASSDREDFILKHVIEQSLTDQS